MFRYLLEINNRLEIMTFEVGEEAMAELSLENPDLFITDQRHPGMKCDEMFEALSRRRISYPIFVICGASARRKKELSKMSRELRLTIKVLPKPYLIDELRRLLSPHFHLSA